MFRREELEEYDRYWIRVKVWKIIGDDMKGCELADGKDNG